MIEVSPMMTTKHKNARNITPFLKQTDIFVSGKEGYRTYRIPAIVVSTKGTILAFCEGRKYGSGDAGKIDIMLKRSFNGGVTWENMQVIVAEEDMTCGNPCPLVNNSTGTILLPFCKNLGDVGEEKIMEGKGPRTVWITKSTDDGADWSEPVDITADVKEPSWTWYATGPGHGIQLKSGRLVIPCDHVKGKYFSREKDPMYSHIIYSDDHGDHWKLGESVGPHMNECAVIQTYGGSLYLNMRNYHPNYRYVRAYAWSKDLGVTWSEMKFDSTLIEPICQASIIRFTDKDSHDKNRVLFSNPASQEKRVKMTVCLSYDECQTWSLSKLLYPGPSAYSDLAIALDMTICCLYERGEKNPYEKITFANFNIEWLTDGADHLNPSMKIPDLQNR